MKKFSQGFIDGYENLLNFDSKVILNKNYSDDFLTGNKLRILHCKLLKLDSHVNNLKIENFGMNNTKAILSLVKLEDLEFLAKFENQD